MRAWHAAPLLLGALAGCIARNAVWLDSASTRQNLVFRIADSPGGSAPPSYFYGLSVTSCGGNVVVWTLRNREDAPGPPPSRVRYGEAPPGYYSAQGPLPLTPGCYKVVVSGPASTEFHVAADGRVSAPQQAKRAAAARSAPSRPATTASPPARPPGGR